MSDILCKSGGGGNQDTPPGDFDDGKYINPSSDDLDRAAEEQEIREETADEEC